MESGQLPYLDTFAKAAELNSFTAAAHALGLTQAAISQRVQALERDLGTPLFRRRGGRVLPTDAGRRLYALAQQILALHREARHMLGGVQPPAESELVLTTSSVPGEHLLPELLARFRARFPGFRLKVTVGDSETALGQVEQGLAHLGLVGRRGDCEHLEYRVFAEDTLALVVPVGHPWARHRRVPLARMGTQPLIVREAGSGSRWCLERALDRAGKSVRDLQVVLELGSNEAITAAVLRGLGMAVLSNLAVEREVRAGRLRSLTVTGLSLTREFFATWDRRRVMPAPGRLFLDLLCPPQARSRSA